MKKSVSLFAFLCIVMNASANNNRYALTARDSTKNAEQKFELGARTGFYVTASYIANFNYYGYLTLQKGIHEFSVGPSIEWPFKLNGVDLTYRILPNGPGKVFDFYFQLNYFQKWEEKTITKNMYDYSTNYYQTDQVKFNATASQLLLEYGFDIKFLRHFYVGMGIGIGGQITFRNYDYMKHDELNYKTTAKDLDFILRTNVGFRF